ncbi:MAG TPA: tripartite tricarboxylate transporter substrate-binding protein [Burkholderiales bacterium]|jgi:tripartite-type tricarboxylate transporter receptor subunit TctC|nr:tripartite tricarboxylate transporter substrate-binding protein [Burkholderiales bacterium]
MRLLAFALALAAVFPGAPALAQYPAKPIRVIVPFPAGGGADTVTRIIAQPLAEALRQPVTVENRPGADGAIAADAVIKSPPDGYTLFMATSSAMSAVPAMRKEPPYDPVSAFTPVTKIGTFSYFLFTHPSVPASNVRELITYIRANPGKVNYAGPTTTGTMAAVQLAGFANLDMVRVPYKGEGAATLDLVSGRVQLMFATPTNAMGPAKEGRLRVLATLLRERSPIAPQVPTMAEAGAPPLSIVPWAGLFGPAGLPKEVVTLLNKEVTSILGRTEVREQIARQAFEVQTSSPEELAAYTREQIGVWKKAVQASGLPLE